MEHTHTTIRTRPDGKDCPVGCVHCGIGAGPDKPGALTGKRLAASAAGAFLAPLILAALAATLCPPGAKPLAAVVGLVAGALIAPTAVRRLARPAETHEEIQ